MTDREALYRAIIANSSEDTPRLVYADWLQENDRPEEAEFIRLGCWLATASPDHPDFVERQVRQEELAIWLAAYAPGPKLKFKAGLEVEAGAGWWTFTRRGFPRFIEFDGTHHPGVKAIRALAASLTHAFDTLPTRWLVIRYVSNEQLAELLRQPIMAQLDSLTVQFYTAVEPNTEAACLIANAPNLKNLRGLSLGFNWDEAGTAALCQSKHLGGLEWFSIPGEELSPSAVRAYGSADWFCNLREFRPGPFFPGEGFAELCRLGPFRKMHSLKLQQTYFADGVWRAFAESGAFPALVHFEVADHALDAAQMAVLARMKWFRASHVDLSFCYMTDETAVTLASAAWLKGVRWLGLRGNVFGPTGAAALARSPNLANLRYLDLSQNSVGARGLGAVAANPALRRLISLDLGGRPHHVGHLTAKHFEGFLSKLDMPQLRHLSLRGRPIGAKAARLLANEKFASLTRLNLRDCGLTDATVRALLEAPALQNLVELRLEANKLKAGLEPLANPRIMPRLGAFYLEGNRVGDVLAAKLARRPGVQDF